MNKNAIKDARWDAVKGLGKNNQYNQGSASWRTYEYVYARTMAQIAARTASTGSAIRLPK